jgi:hypothetical protein
MAIEVQNDNPSWLEPTQAGEDIRTKMRNILKCENGVLFFIRRGIK